MTKNIKSKFHYGVNNRGISSLVFIIVGIILVVVIVSIISLIRGRTNPVTEVTKRATQVITGGAGFDFDKDTPGYENLSTLSQGCPFKDCISSIDEPVFESVTDADTWLVDDDVVFVLNYLDLTDKDAIINIVGPITRAYPQRIMNWHEIVNDEFYGNPFTVTFCPLCGSALAFDSRVNGEVLEFGVSGKLHDNDLVMYDRQTETLWQQITGEGIVGTHFGKRLKQIPMSGMRWSQFKEDFSKGLVLSRDTGFSRSYDRYPYGSYEQDRAPLFPVSGGVDNTIHPKTVVYGVEIEKSFKAYPEEKIKTEGEIEDTLGGARVKISYKNGDIEVKNIDSGDEIPATRLFWFAWKAFRPETELY